MRVSAPHTVALVLSAVSSLVLATTAQSDEVALTPIRDNTIFSEDGSTSNGAGMYLFAGRTNQGHSRRALLAFDVAGNIPAGATIESVTLRLQMSKTISGAETVSLHRILGDWGEGASDAASSEGAGAPAATGDATWTHAFFETTTWATAGGDFAPAASATQSVASTSAYTWGSTAEMVTDVQSWLDAPAENFGWILRGNEGTNRSAKRFNSRENGSTATRPQLTVVFSSKQPQETPTHSATPTGTATPSGLPATATPTATSGTALPCPGDCNGDETVTVNELVLAVNIALGQSDLSTCPPADSGDDGAVTVNELISAVNAALAGCP